MKIAARLERSKQQDRRSEPRHRLRLGTNIRPTDENASIHDISSTGMLIETGVKLRALDTVKVELPENGPTEALVMWNSGRFYGCEFKHPLSKAAISAAFLRSAPADTQEVSKKANHKVSVVATATIEEEGAVQTDAEKVENRLPLRVRALAIIASAVLLWALIISGAEILIRLADPSFG